MLLLELFQMNIGEDKLNEEIAKYVRLVVPRDAFVGFDFLVRLVGLSREHVLAQIMPVSTDTQYGKRRDICNQLLGHPRFRASINASALAKALTVLHGEEVALELLHKYRFVNKKQTV